MSASTFDEYEARRPVPTLPPPHRSLWWGELAPIRDMFRFAVDADLCAATSRTEDQRIYWEQERSRWLDGIFLHVDAQAARYQVTL